MGEVDKLEERFEVHENIALLLKALVPERHGKILKIGPEFQVVLNIQIYGKKEEKNLVL